LKTFRRILLPIALYMALIGCTTTIVTRVVIQPVQDTIDMKSMIDAVTYVLTNNGLDVAFINEKYGLINSGWRPIQSGADTAASVLSIVGSAMSRGPSSYSTYSRDMMISFQFFANEYRVIPKLRRKTNTTGFYGGSNREDVEYPTADSNEGKLVTKIVSEINGLLKVADDIQWEEKVVTVGEEPG
jgi:hypothetical protein